MIHDGSSVKMIFLISRYEARYEGEMGSRVFSDLDLCLFQKWCQAHSLASWFRHEKSCKSSANLNLEISNVQKLLRCCINFYKQRDFFQYKYLSFDNCFWISCTNRKYIAVHNFQGNVCKSDSSCSRLFSHLMSHFVAYK